MSERNLKPITAGEIEDLQRQCENWFDTRWGSEMPASTSRGLAKDVLRLLEYTHALEKQLRKNLEKPEDEDFRTNPCTMCGSPPGVTCEHDE